MMEEQKFTFTRATAAMAAPLKNLWQIVFGDRPDYIGLFFNNRFVPENTMVALFEGMPVAMLYLLPITIRENNIDYNARYIYAVGTHPDYRSQGLSGALLKATHTRLAQEGVALSLLVPAEPSLFAYYGMRGFSTEFYRKTVAYAPKKGGPLATLKTAQLPELLMQRDRLFGQSALYARWNAEALAYQQKEAALLGGETLTFDEPEAGYALCYPAGDAVIIKEWAANALYPAVLNAIAARFDRERILLRLPADFGVGGAPEPFAMTRWYLSERNASQGKAPYLSLVLD
ncbi:MAG: GNAT family N-acetyltransferase [Candidatus Fimivivens sp.]|nr:GNAT family N-acetyltransferase [Candidatus Fimivivens sp.]